MAIKLGASNRIIKRKTNLPATKEFSIGAWFKVKSVRASAYQYFLNAELTETDASEWCSVGYNDTGAFEISIGNGGYRSLSLRTPEVGRWEFFAISNTDAVGSGITVFQKKFQAVALESYSLTGTNFIPGAYSFGNDSYDEWCDVEIAEAFIYNRALSSQEILAIANMGVYAGRGLNSLSSLDTSRVLLDKSGVGARVWELGGSGSTTSAFPLPLLKSKLSDVTWYVATSSSVDALTTSDFATSASSVGVPQLLQIHNLSSSSLTSGQLTVDVVAINQIHALIATSPTTGPPTVDSVVILQNHALAPSNLTTSSIDVSAAVVGQKHTLLAGNLTFGVIEVGAASIVQEHVLVSGDVEAGAVIVGAPSLSGEAVLSANDVAFGTPTVTTPTILQIHALLSPNITSGEVELQTPLLGIIFVLSAQDSVAQNISVDSTILGQVHALLTANITSNNVVVDTPSLQGEGSLFADNVFTGSLSVDIPVLTQHHSLSSSGVACAAIEVDAPILLQSFTLLAENVNAGAIVESPVLSQIISLSSLNVFTSSFEVEESSIYQVHSLETGILIFGIPSIGSPSLDRAARPITKRTVIIEYSSRIKNVTTEYRQTIIDAIQRIKNME